MVHVKNYRKSLKKITQLAFLLCLAVSVTACGSLQDVNFKVNSEPEGAHVILKMTSPEQERIPEWIYLGNTPFQGVRIVHDDVVTEGSKVTLKVMRAGYYDQTKEWSGESFIDEAEARGMIFWAPHLIKHPKTN